MKTLREMSLPVKIWTVPAEIPSPIRLSKTRSTPRTTPTAANRFWRILVQVERVLTGTRCAFIGKCQPRSFLLGRDGYRGDTFLGRPAPPREGPAFMREAYHRK